jgi:hypothetical protein
MLPRVAFPKDHFLIHNRISTMAEPPQPQPQPQQQEQQPPPPPAIVSAGDSDHLDDEDDETLKYTGSDQLYGANLDDEDEAWVYQNLRSGTSETVTVAPRAAQQQQAQVLEQAKLLKPRNSDAVLSCPCCFTIVCMDCQRHETLRNQFRAMFVMNITVGEKLVYDNHSKQLMTVVTTGSSALLDDDDDDGDDQDEVYHSVHCLQCRTQVAALDMKEELYHFFGCLASS